MLSGNEKFVASGGFDHRVWIYSLDTYKQVGLFKEHKGIINSIVFERNRLIIASEDGFVTIYDF